MSKIFDLNEPLPDTVDLEAGRRAFIKTLGIGAFGAATLGASGMANAANGAADADVLNFALNLEYLEANFYLQAAYGRYVAAGDTTGTGTPGQATGGHKVPFKEPLVQAYAFEIANDEEKHVKLLRAALGNAKVAQPAINVGTAFTTAARAAKLIGPTQTFDAYASDANFLLGAYIFEDVGVTAYHGAARFLTDNITYLQVAAGILAVEAYHAGIVRTALFAKSQNVATQKISTLRQSLGPVVSSTAAVGGTVVPPGDVGVGTVDAPTIVPVDSFSVAYERPTRSVLNVVYGAQNTHRGLFFPNGLNGNIK